MSPSIVFAASLAQKPFHGGHAWFALQYLLGFRRLGWDVFLFDRLDPEMCKDASGRMCPVEESINLRYLRGLMNKCDMRDAYAVESNGGGEFHGCSRHEVEDRIRRSTLLVNVMGFLANRDLLDLAPRRVFLDIDPGFGQIWRAEGLADIFDGHDQYVTVGENMGQPDCEIPTCGLSWITTPQPVVLEEWPEQTLPPERGFSSVVSWRGAYGPVEHRGRTWGLRVHEFRKFAAVPRMSGKPCELALQIDPGDDRDRILLEEGGWRLVDPQEAAGSPDRYRRYVQSSMAEFMIAKNIYVQSHSGWFSDRSICYLASGRPVVGQETGYSQHHPTGKGLLAFTTPQEALAAMEEVSRDYALHSRAARRIAEEHFDSDQVLRRLLEKLGVA